MKKVGIIVGLFCFTAGQASSQTFEEQVAGVSAEAKNAGQALAVSKAQGGDLQGCRGCGPEVLNSADALDETKAGIAAKFIVVKPGEIEMGSPADEAGRYLDETQHTVKLTKGYEMQATEVTQLQYFLVMGRNPSGFRKQENCDGDNFKVMYGQGLCVNHPVENVSWDDAQKFIERLNKIQDKHTYRLPTEAEWEYAARGGMPSVFPYSFGFNDTNELGNHAWYYGNSGLRTHAVASKKANPRGLFDMHGNAWEWVQDWYGNYPTGAVSDPTGPSAGSYRGFRGGSWDNVAVNLRSANRNYDDPGFRLSGVGLRLVRVRR